MATLIQIQAKLAKLQAQAAVPVASKANAAGNYIRRPQPEKYRGPKSGATWSGCGRVPAWLAGAKDRTKFLIGENRMLKQLTFTVVSDQ